MERATPLRDHRSAKMKNKVRSAFTYSFILKFGTPAIPYTSTSSTQPTWESSSTPLWHSGWARNVKVPSALYSCDSRWKLHLINVVQVPAVQPYLSAYLVFFTAKYVLEQRQGNKKRDLMGTEGRKGHKHFPMQKTHVLHPHIRQLLRPAKHSSQCSKGQFNVLANSPITTFPLVAWVATLP